MRLEQLEYLLAVKHTESMNLAGQAFHVSQQAISHALKELENELGCRLLYKTNKGSYLTPSGEIVARYAEQTFALLKEMRQALNPQDRLASSAQTVCTVVFSHSAEQLYRSRLISFWYQHHPEKQLNTMTANVDEVVGQVLARQVDLGCLTLDKEGMERLPSEVVFTSLQTFYPYIICSPACPLSEKNGVFISELADYRITTKASQDQAENYGYKLLAKHQMLKNVTLSSMADSQFIQELVTNNVAVGVFFHIQGLSGSDVRLADEKQLYVPILEKEKFHFGYLLHKQQNRHAVQLAVDALHELCTLRNASYFM